MSVYAQLDGTADTNAARIAEDPEPFATQIGTVFSDPLQLDDLVPTFEKGFDASQPSLARGLAGFALFARAMENCSRGEDSDENIARAREYLRDPDVIDFFRRRWYDVSPTISLDGADIHRYGTTSFLLRCMYVGGVEELALKCLIPRYESVRSVSVPFANYRTLYGQLGDRLDDDDRKSIPRLGEDGERYLPMEFIPGDTVREALERDALTSEIDERMGRLAVLGEKTTRILAVLASLDKPVHHLDLTPDNIILRENAWEHPVLIDFGRNTLLSERVAVGANYARVITFAAPEVQQNAKADTALSDVYSLGVVALYVATGREPTLDNVDDLLSLLWTDTPNVARVVEDMVDGTAANRLALIPAGPEPDRLRAIGSALAKEARATKVQFESDAKPKNALWLRAIPRSRRADALRFWRHLRPAPPSSTDLGEVGLSRWLMAHRLAWWFVALLAIALIVAEIPAVSSWVGILPGPMENWLRDQGIIGSFREQFPGRLLALTTGLIAYAYYEQTFATLDPRPVPTGWGRFAAVWTRTAILFSILLQIIAVLFPIPWSFITCGIGGILVAINNYSWRRIAKDAAERARKRAFSHIVIALKQFDEIFRAWPFLMGVYSLGGVVVGVSIELGWANDVWFYAMGMVFVNLFKIYRYNIIGNSAWARANLGRAVFTVERQIALDGTTPAIPPPAVDPVPVPART